MEAYVAKHSSCSRKQRTQKRGKLKDSTFLFNKSNGQNEEYGHSSDMNEKENTQLVGQDPPPAYHENVRNRLK